jgi:hypothetical protein
VLRVLLEEWAWGRPECWPSDATIAALTSYTVRTVGRCLHDLCERGVIRILHPGTWRRRIEFPTHPGLAVHLDTVSVHLDRMSGAPRQGVRQSVVVKPGDEAQDVVAPPILNESTKVPPPRPRRFRDLPSLADAPADDPIVAAELARRAASPGVARPLPTKEEILTAALDAPSAAPDGPTGAPGALTGDPGAKVDRDSHPTPRSQDGAISAVSEAATIEALSKLGPGASKGEILSAALRLTALFRDPGSRAYYRSVCNEVVRGRLPVRVVVAAIGSARGPGIRVPGAAFTGHIKRCKAAAESRRGNRRTRDDHLA